MSAIRDPKLENSIQTAVPMEFYCSSFTVINRRSLLYSAFQICPTCM